MNKLFVGAVVLIVLGIGFLAFSFNDDSNITGNFASENSDDLKTFVLTGENFKFVSSDGVDNPDIVVNKGDRVRIEFSSTSGFHDWVIDEFKSATKQVRDTDGKTFAEFVASEAGEFEYYCSVGQHRANGMRGNLVVE